MSGEGIVVMADKADCHSSENTKMSNVDLEKPKGETPRGTEGPVDAAPTTAQKDECVPSKMGPNEEDKTHVGDKNNRERSAADDFTEPDDELQNKIIKQVEFYFSDANIVKDPFLLKHVQSSKSGYVNLNLIASFKRMKALTKDKRVIAFSLRNSTEVEVHEKGNKLRRRMPLPDCAPSEDRTLFKTVVAMNLEHKSPTVDTVAQEFSQCSGITLIRIIKPGGPIPSDVNQYAIRHPVIGSAMCVLIEFETEEQALHTCKTMTNTEDWRNGRRVAILATPKNNYKKREGKAENVPSSEAETNGGKGTKKNARQKKKIQADQNRTEKSASSSASGSDSDRASSSQPTNPSGDSDSHYSTARTRSGSSRNSQGKSHHAENGDASSAKGGYRRYAPKGSKKNKDGNPGEGSGGSSPWVQRRRQAAAQEGKTNDGPVTGHAVTDSPVLSQAPRNMRWPNMVEVPRQPRGPDGTRGFHGLGRGKPRCNTIA